MKNNKKLMLYIVLTLLFVSGCNKNDSNTYVSDNGPTKEDIASEETIQHTIKTPFALDEKVQGFYHTEDMNETSSKEYSNAEEAIREFGLETVIDAPVYEYYDEDGEVCLSLYYDENQELGMVWFDPSVDFVDNAKCYVFYGSEIDKYAGPEMFLPYETSTTGNYLVPVLSEYEETSYHSNTASPTYVSITEKNDSSKEVAHIDYLYYSELESELKCVKFSGQQAVFGNKARDFEIWYENNGTTLHDGIVIGDIKYQMYNIDNVNKYEFYGKVGEKKISIIICDEKICVAGL